MLSRFCCQGIVWRPAALVFLAISLGARPSAAQDMSGVTFDVTMTTGDSATGRTQTGRGWIAEKHSRLDLRGPGNPEGSMPGMTGENISLIAHDSGGVHVVTMVDHDARKFMYPTRIMEQLKEMMASLPEQPRMAFSVTNVRVDSLGAGATISGLATRRFRLSADISMSLDMMGEILDQSMHIESEGDYAEELSDYADPLRDSRGFTSLTSGMSWMDSSATAEMEKLARAAPRGLALRQVDRVTGASESGMHMEMVTALSNIKRTTFSPAVFVIPEGYTEMEMPQMPAMN